MLCWHRLKLKLSYFSLQYKMWRKLRWKRSSWNTWLAWLTQIWLNNPRFICFAAVNLASKIVFCIFIVTILTFFKSSLYFFLNFIDCAHIYCNLFIIVVVVPLFFKESLLNWFSKYLDIRRIIELLRKILNSFEWLFYFFYLI